MERLPDGAREVFVLHDVEGYRHEEIAEMLGLGNRNVEISAAPRPHGSATAPGPLRQRMSDNWTDRLSEYLDGELPEAERAALECASARLRRLLQSSHRAACRSWRRLVLWKTVDPRRTSGPAISARIGAAPASRDTVDLGSRRRRRQWSFSLPQLAAAGLALMTLSGGSVWLLESARLQSEYPAAGRSHVSNRRW